MGLKFTYANVTSTLALFLAMGGSAVAVTSLDGSTIKVRSIPNNRFKQISTSSSLTSKSKKARLSATSGTAESTIVTADVGQTAQLLEVSGLKLWLQCVTVERGNYGYRLTSSHSAPRIYATTDEDNTVSSYQSKFIDQPKISDYSFDRGEKAETGIDGTQAIPMGWYQAFLRAPSGKYMSAAVNYGVGQFGGDCWASAFTLQ